MRVIFQRLANDSHYLIGKSVAREQRLRWEGFFSDGSTRIVVNMSEIKQVSDSYARELFGEIVNKFGRDWFDAHIKFVCCEEHHRRRIMRAVGVPLQ